MVGIGSRPVARGPRRADVHLVDFADTGGHVIRGPHPAVIVSSDRLNRPSGTVLLCPLTSRIRHDADVYLPPYLVTVGARSSGLDRDGYIKVDQLFTRPVETLGPRIGRVDPETIDRLDAALRFVLAI